MFCKTCEGKQRVPTDETHAGIRGIWTKVCPDCKGTGVTEDSDVLKEIRGSVHYKVGYYRSAVKTILTMLEHGGIDSAIQHCKDTLITLENPKDTL
jgi:hypothetical protein